MQVVHWISNAQDLRKILSQCTRFVQDCTSFSNVQYMRKICTRLYFIFLRCPIYVQDLHKIILISSMRNICARFAQDCTYFSNVQYMRKTVLISIYAQDLCKIILLSSMRNICTRSYFFPQCTRFVQDCTDFSNVQDCTCACTYFPNAQYICKIVPLAIYAQDCRHYWKKYVTYHISVLNLKW